MSCMVHQHTVCESKLDTKTGLRYGVLTCTECGTEAMCPDRTHAHALSDKELEKREKDKEEHVGVEAD